MDIKIIVIIAVIISLIWLVKKVVGGVINKVAPVILLLVAGWLCYQYFF